MPTTVCGIANGKSTIVSTKLSNLLNFFFAIRNARGTPKSRENIAVIKDREILFQIDMITDLSFKASKMRLKEGRVINLKIGNIIKRITKIPKR
jgi:hypothetical protein